MGAKAVGIAPIIRAVTWLFMVRQEIDIETWAGPTFEIPRVVTGLFTVSREGTHGSAPSIVCTPSTESLERTLCQLLAAYSRLEVNATGSQRTSRLRCT